MPPGPADDFPRLLAECRRFLLSVAAGRMAAGLASKYGPSDVVQDTLAAALRRRDQYRGRTEGDLRAWLRAILVNEMAAARRKVADPLDPAAPRERPAGAGGGNPVCRHPTPPAAAAATDDRAGVEAALAALPAADRLVIALRFEERLGFREIGARVGRSEEAARKQFTRAVAGLRGRLPAGPAGG